MRMTEETLETRPARSSVVAYEPGTAREQFLARFTENIQLPRPPAVVLRVLEKASQPDCSLHDLTEIVHQDPVLCGKLLQTVNSAAFGLRHFVTSIQQALSLLGLKQARSLALSLSLPAIYGNPGPGALAKEIWMYSLSIAVIARELAIQQGRSSPAEDLIAGLLCDLGTMVLQQANPEGIANLFLNTSRALAQNQCELEDQCLGVNHAELSAYLLATWRLPVEITEPVRCHHNPSLLAGAGPEIEGRAWLLYFASQVTSIQTRVRLRNVSEELLGLAQSRFHMNRQQLLTFLEPLKSRVQEFADLMHVEIADCADFAKLFSSATQELVKITIETSVESARARDDSLETGLWRLLRMANQLPQRIGSVQSNGAGQPASELRHAPHDSAPAGHVESMPAADRPDGEIKLGHYTVIEVLGRGGMGIVFRAYDNALRRHVAIKILGPGPNSSDLRHARFAREGEIAASISHENVVTVYAVGGAGEISYLIMEYVDGMSLQDRLEMDPPLGIKEIVQFGSQIIEGLAAAHARDLIHRDIKPANILLMNSIPRAKITDFGLARPVSGSTLTEDGTVMGTPHYMAPEQVRGEQLDFRSDLFSFGGVLYAMCTGQPPFGMDHTNSIMKRIVDESPRPIHDVNRTIPDELIAIVDKLLVKAPAARYQSAKDVAKLLRRLMLRLM
jgi:eukaryotic-like serine/threonine-protein kinase